MEIWRRNLYVLMGCQFLVMGSMSMIIPFLPLYLKEMGMNDPAQAERWAGLVYGANFFSAFLVAPLWGNLADRYGRKLMVLRSGFGMAVVLFLTGLATSPLQLLLLRLLNGTVSGFIPASISLMAAHAPREKTGYALGMLQSGSVAGSIMGPFFGGLLAEWIRYRNIFFLTGIMLAIASTVVLILVHEPSRPAAESKQVGFFREGKALLKERPLVLLFSIGFLLQVAMMGPVPLMSLFVADLGAPGGYVAFFAGLVTATTGLANLMFSPVLGRLGDRFGPERVLFFALIGAALIFIPHSLVRSIWQLLTFRFLLGLCVGGLLPSLYALIRRHAPEGKVSTAFGFQTSAVNLGNMLGPVAYGFLSGMTGIRGVFPVTSALLLLTALWLKTGLKVMHPPLVQKEKQLKNLA
jgi:DHA1 family multidrug resistance protein-like MFS transporter